MDDEKEIEEAELKREKWPGVFEYRSAGLRMTMDFDVINFSPLVVTDIPVVHGNFPKLTSYVDVPVSQSNA